MLVGGLVIHFGGIFLFILLRSKVIQEFHACAMVETIFQFFWGKYDP
jgi:hypothetical protein